MVRLPSVVLSWLLLSSIAMAQDSADASEAEAFDRAAIPTMLSRINAMRAAQSLPALMGDPRLDAVALAHSQDMAEHDMVAHDSPRTGNPMDRALRAGLNVRHVAENVAQHTSVMGAHLGFVQSETHRHNLLQADLTHIGIGVVRVGRRVYITQLFAEFADTTPQEVPAAPAPNAISEAEPSLPGNTPVSPPNGTPSVVEPIAAAPSSGAGQNSSPPQLTSPPPQTTDEPIAAYAPQANQATQGDTGPRRVAGYWVRGNTGRWWYYPLPADARPGQVLQPDLSVQGGPGAYGGNAPSVRSNVVRPPPSSPPFGWSPRRRYQYWNSTP